MAAGPRPVAAPEAALRVNPVSPKDVTVVAGATGPSAAEWVDAFLRAQLA